MKPFILLLATLPLLAQQPRIVNAKFENKASSNLKADVDAATARGGPLWIGWSVPQVAGAGNSCCSTSRDGQVITQGCALEPNTNVTQVSSGPIHLEGASHSAILLRVEGGTLDKVRLFGSDCSLDAGGLPVVWLTGVKPADSVNFLAAYTRQHFEEHRKGGAIAAIAVHDDPQADRVLNEFVQPSQPEELRRSTVFWLGNTRGKSGFETLQRLLKDDPSPGVKEQVVFALTLTKDPRGMDTIIQAAKSDPNPEVRSKALFWMAQKAGRKALGPITSAVENDPDTKVKRQAVFALTQMPSNEGVPALIEVAKNNKNQAVRKQAFFWLGQSKDERATRFLEQVLTAKQ
ncbi:HEAT repeat domain-containing protein [Paludibaculum fermentans]|uniref:HEAT repeat domain-containing protein n=1 Tax=Paludibaculum fermentans TaxID=1473598 RepID=A0A7S7NM13_PALFE|nr:HEAT repeat domain-containing protein [Paludibaculum fermentans]QOY86111.1 HEAT repeat domain-containing protein [Paludibaculum fermentans]